MEKQSEVEIRDPCPTDLLTPDYQVIYQRLGVGVEVVTGFHFSRKQFVEYILAHLEDTTHVKKQKEYRVLST